VYGIIKDKIINLELNLGQRIDIQKIATELGISQTPVREALNRLAKDRLISINPRKGYYVTDISPEDMEEIYDIRRIFEVYALDSAIENIDLYKLKKLKQKMEEELRGRITRKKRKTKFEIDKQLHLLIVNSSKNKKLKEMYYEIYDFIKIFQRMNPGFKETLEEHIALIDTIIKKDTEEAKKLLAVHIENAKGRIIKVFKNMKGGNKQNKSTSKPI
ncbi:GntR family transcriptional regulator, partial [Candidatus Aerophobetes bacterium]|nr:GntR family transcriptional regulator [Candidatus Aerophobetes bacterium]